MKALEFNKCMCYNSPVASPKLVTERGVLLMEILTPIIIAVVADLISLLIRKWLDDDEK